MIWDSMGLLGNQWASLTIRLLHKRSEKEHIAKISERTPQTLATWRVNLLKTLDLQSVKEAKEKHRFFCRRNDTLRGRPSACPGNWQG
ncbi:hypothetical protein [Henriciella mobilis]|uniref:hypothetical protein n=1 Tax=Henriciella mobilis TaxID=2305467 RepID=UPI0011C3DF3A|nr:hypothetical protein [Henriciella mobilis]